MGQILHGSARTTEAVRRAIQHSQESLPKIRQAIIDRLARPPDRPCPHCGRRPSDPPTKSAKAVLGLGHQPRNDQPDEEQDSANKQDRMITKCRGECSAHLGFVIRYLFVQPWLIVIHHESSLSHLMRFR